MTRSQKCMGYLVAVVATILMLLIRLSLSEGLAEQARLLPFLIAVMAAAWAGGLGPGLLATFLCALLGIYFVVPPLHSLRIETVADGLNAGFFVIVGVTISLIIDALHKARRSEAEKQFRTLADSVAQLVWMARPDGYRFWFNKRWYEYTGTILKQVEGSAWQTLCDPADLPRVLKSWNKAVAAGTPWDETYQLRGRDGQLRWYLARAVPVTNDHGEITRWFGTSTDVHDRIETEKALKEADIRKDRYLATLAHELRNPLAPISNALKLWPRVAHDPEEMEQLRIVMLRQMKHLVRLVDDLLDMARISQGKISLRRNVVDVRSLIQESLEAFRPLLDAAHHQVNVSLPDEPVLINGDGARLTQVFSNIMSNAAKYTGRNGKISIRADRDGDQVAISIRDNGPGIPANLLSKIFEPFYQVDRTIDSAQGGLGIGLTLARQLVNLHGGEIEAHSDGAGQGSEFVVRLPALPALWTGEDRANLLPAQESELVRRRILVVDDLVDSANTLAQLMRVHGLDATAVHDGAAAIEWISTHHPDTVFMDIAMPGLDGYEVARRLRETEELQKTVLVAMTGYGQPGDRRRALESGFSYHLTKPIDWTALESILRQLPVRKDDIETTAV